MITNASDIIATANIVDVVQEYVPLKKKGVNWVGVCPFHGDKNPSMSVHEGKGIYKCFSCGAGGGPAKFIMEHERVSYPEALRKLAVKFKVEIKEDREAKPLTDEQHAAKETAYIALDALQAHFAATESAEATQYWEGRAFKAETLAEFGVGYCDGSKPKLIELESTGLLNENQNLMYYKRTTLPIHNRQGRVVGFAGRTIFAEGEIPKKPATKCKKKEDAEATKEQKGPPKWINNGDSLIYSKGKTLFNLHRADKHIREAKAVYIVEGYADVMAMWQLGLKNVVGLCGTALTPEHVALLKRYNCDKPLKVVLAIDNELRGTRRKKETWAALERMLTVLLPFADTRLLYWGNQKDMGEFLATSGRVKDLREDDALGIWVQENLEKGYKPETPTDWATLQERFGELVSCIGKTSIKDIYIKDFATKLFTNIRTLSDMVKSHSTSVDERINRVEDHEHIIVMDTLLERQPLISFEDNDTVPPMVYVPRQRANIKEEKGKDYLQKLPRYTNFTIRPAHHNYERVITKLVDGKEFRYFNRYDPLPFKAIPFDLPTDFKTCDYTSIKEIKHVAQLFKHIADKDLNGPHFERILWDWVALLYLKPTQRQRALALVSTEEGTGKSTFANLIKFMLGNNAVMTDADRIAANFNALLSGKLLAVVEETNNSRGDIENKLKDYITGRKVTTERKGVDSIEEDTFIKFLFLSNHESTFLKVGTSTTRHIVMKVPLPKNKRADFEDAVYAEIPYLMYFLEQRGVISENRDRLWFHQDEIENDALARLRQGSKDLIQQNTEQLVEDIFLRTSYPRPILNLTSGQVGQLLTVYAGSSYKDKSLKSIQNFLTNTLKLQYREQCRFQGITIDDVNSKDWALEPEWFWQRKEMKGYPIEFPIWRFCKPESIKDMYKPDAIKLLIYEINNTGDQLKLRYPEFDPVAFIKAIELKAQP